MTSWMPRQGGMRGFRSQPPRMAPRPPSGSPPPPDADGAGPVPEVTGWVDPPPDNRPRTRVPGQGWGGGGAGAWGGPGYWGNRPPAPPGAPPPAPTVDTPGTNTNAKAMDLGFMGLDPDSRQRIIEAYAKQSGMSEEAIRWLIGNNQIAGVGAQTPLRM